MKKVTFAAIAVVLFLVNSSLSAQSNETLDRFLAAPFADFGTTAYLILASAGVIDPTAAPEEGLVWLKNSELSGKFRDYSYDRDISLGEFAYILMEAYGIKGGVMYALLPGPRYAAREAVFRKWVLGKGYPERSLRPYEVVNAINLIAEGKEGSL